MECFADVALARAVGVLRGQIRHEGDKGNVLKALRKSAAGIGLVDDDGKGPRFGLLKEYREIELRHDLVLMNHADGSPRRVVIICPRLEDWLYARAKWSGLEPVRFGFPADADRLHSIPRYERNPRFAEFLAELKERDPAFRDLARWISPGTVGHLPAG